MHLMARRNEYQSALDPKLFDACPKAVIAAIAVSVLTVGGDELAMASSRFLAEWWTLYDNGIVPQRPPFPRAEAHE